MMKPEAVISVEQVSKNYGTFRAVDHVSFDIHRGEIFALLGPNGSGKTTLIRMILDILKPDTGRIAVFGAPLNDATKARIGYLPEERGLYRNVPVLDVMVYLGRLKGMAHDAARRRSLELLAQLELTESARKKVSELSKGMQQKVQFAVTILHQPDIIIIDEPFSGLDPVNTLLIKAMLTDFRQNGGTIVMSTHQMHQVEEMADRLLMISKGQQKLYGPLAQIRQQYAKHAIVVEGQGNWAALPGVASVEGWENGRAGAVLHLQDDATTDSVLAAIAASQDTSIRRFELAVPSLNEIFIEVAGGDRHE
jgi:ABC-2 type transport system ATP-binding protein